MDSYLFLFGVSTYVSGHVFVDHCVDARDPVMREKYSSKSMICISFPMITEPGEENLMIVSVPTASDRGIIYHIGAKCNLNCS